MQRRAADRQGMGDLRVGTIVHMRVEDVDRAKIDNVNATLVVLDRTEHGNYVVGNKAGIYKEKVSRPYLTPVKHATPRMMALDKLLEEYQDEGRRAKLRWVSVRRVAGLQQPAQLQAGRACCIAHAGVSAIRKDVAASKQGEHVRRAATTTTLGA